MKAEQIVFRATSDDVLKLTELARACGLSRSGALCELIRHASVKQHVTFVPKATISTQNKSAALILAGDGALS